MSSVPVADADDLVGDGPRVVDGAGFGDGFAAEGFVGDGGA